MATSIHRCYALECQVGRVRSYVGYSVDPFRRIRQHNAEIKGGARRTTTAAKTIHARWEFLFIIEVEHPDWDKHLALSLEWHLKAHRQRRSTRSGGQGLGWDKGGPAATTQRRVHLLTQALRHHKFRRFLPHMVIWVRDDADVCNRIWVATLELHDITSMPPVVLPLTAIAWPVTDGQ